MAKANPESIKWPTDKPRYDKNYLRLYGKQCPICGGRGVYEGTETTCVNCNGLGYVEKSKNFWTEKDKR